MSRLQIVGDSLHAARSALPITALAQIVVRENLAGLRLRVPLPPGLVLLNVAAAHRSTIAEVVGRALPLYQANTPAECHTLLEQHAGLAVLVTVPPEGFLSDVERLVELRLRFPHAGWTGLFEDSVSEIRNVAALGRAGISELVTTARLQRPGVLLDALSRGETESIAARVWRLAGICVDDASATLLKPALRLAHAPISLTRLAEATRLHERTLRKYCTHASIPSPQWIIGWARCLVASYYLEEPGRSVSSIAALLEFKTSVLLANQIRRYTGLTSTALRQQGPLQTTGRLLERHLQGSRAARHPTFGRCASP